MPNGFRLLTPTAVLTLIVITAAAQADTAKTVLSFETDADMANTRLNHSKANVVAVGNTEGAKALQVEFTDANYPGITWSPQQPWDWSGYGGVAVDVTNLDNEATTFALRVDDQAGSDGKVGSRTGAGRLQALEKTTYILPFNNDPASPWRGTLPGMKTMRDTSGTATAFNPGHIVAMTLFVAKPASPKTLVFDNFRLVQASADTLVRATEPKLLFDFENPEAAAAAMTNKSAVSVVPTGGTQGPHALQMDFQVSEWPNVAFKTPGNWEAYAGLALDVSNPEKTAQKFAVRIDDTNSVGGGTGWTGTGSIEPGGKGSFVVSFGVDPMSLGMQALPPISKELRAMGGGGSATFDFSKVAQFQIFLLRPGSPHTLTVDNIRLVPGPKPDFKNLVDSYGQYTREDWPGKIKTDADLTAARDREAAELKAAALPDRDKFGGWAKGPQLKATGFFRTEKYNGKWGIVDPDGHLFLSLGITSLTPAAATITTGREYMFSALPANDPMLDKFKGHVKNLWQGPVKEGDTIDFYAANLNRKYGENYKTAWQDVSLARLPAWGFNTVANFSSWSYFNNGKVPYVAAVWPAAGHAKVPHAFEPWNSMDDPFDPKFATDVTSFASGIAAKIKDDPYCLGYFVGNEEKWGNGNSPRSHFGLALGALKLQQAASPAKAAFAGQLKDKYGDIAKFNAAWGQNLADWDALAAPLAVKEPFNDAMTADLSAFTKAYATKYFQTVRDELKKLDSNHMYLGVRFAGYTPEAVQACAEATDVMSFNVYRYGIAPEEWSVLNGIDHPVIVGEFHFGATDRGMFHGSLVPTANQTERGKAFEGYVRSVVDNPLFVGCHWFQYVDEPLLGRPGDGENYNCGFVSVTDTPYPEMVAAARQVSGEMYTRRFGK